MLGGGPNAENMLLAENVTDTGRHADEQVYTSVLVCTNTVNGEPFQMNDSSNINIITVIAATIIVVISIITKYLRPESVNKLEV